MENMENRKNCASPRSMVDDALLKRLLDESEPLYCRYGCQKSPGRQMNSGCAVHSPMPEQKQVPEMQHDMPSGGCGCDENETCAKKNCISGWPLAMSYTPDQEWRSLYEIDDALNHGTLFSELDFPFYPGCGNCR